jgi:hypothetical protein
MRSVVRPCNGTGASGRTIASVPLWHTVVASALLVAIGCKGGPPSPSPVPGATIVRGTERLAWSQAGHVSTLRFRAYVDDTPVLLDAAVCDGSAPEASCSSPLPPMLDGVHTIALASVLGTSLESERSEPLIVQKVSGGPSSLASLHDADVGTGAIGLQATVQVSPDLVLAADVIARGIRAPAQMAWMPEGRLLIAEADGGVRVVHVDGNDRAVYALDADRARRMFGAAPAGTAGLAIHPDFARNQTVYMARLVDEGASGRRLRVVRLREAGDTLGDPAQLFETTVVGQASSSPEGPRLAFGPDGLLYVALPAGIAFDREPAASRPHGSMLRLRDDGLVADLAPLTGVRAHPIAFTWDPSTGALWLAFAEAGVTTLEPATAGRAPFPRPRVDFTRTLERLHLSTTFRAPPAARALVIRDAAGLQTHHLTDALLRTRGAASTVRLIMPLVAGSLSDRLGDFVSAADGTWFVVTSNGAGHGDVIVRLRTIN